MLTVFVGKAARSRWNCSTAYVNMWNSHLLAHQKHFSVIIKIKNGMQMVLKCKAGEWRKSTRRIYMIQK